jgi:predicted RNA methylase
MSAPRGIDAHYTPGWVADRVAIEVASLSIDDRPHVADYAAGDGALLHAVVRLLPQARITATDVDPAAVRTLKAANAAWSVGTCDFLSARSRATSPLVGPRGNSPDFVVLNPPFSYRGGTYLPVLRDTFRASPAMGFVANALERLATGGSAVVLVPSGCLHAQRDEMLWTRLREAAAVRVVEEFGRTTFRGEHSNVSLIVLSGLRREILFADTTLPFAEPAPAQRVRAADVALVRGTQQMHTLRMNRKGLPLVHSTHLAGGAVLAGPRISTTAVVHAGPAVLLPRVGLPRRDKIVLWLPRDQVVLSDCVMALRGRNLSITRQLHAVLIDAWDELAALYRGSCARYLTVRDLRNFVEKFGFSVELKGRLR